MSAEVTVVLEGEIVDVLSITGGLLATGDITELADGSLAADMGFIGAVYVPAAFFDEDGELQTCVTAEDEAALVAAVAKWWSDVRSETELEQQWMWEQQQEAYAEEQAAMEDKVRDEEEQVQA